MGISKDLPTNVVATEIFTPVAGVIGKENGDRPFVSDACIEVSAETVCSAGGRTDCEHYLVIDSF
jgi:hypothetical protein